MRSVSFKNPTWVCSSRYQISLGYSGLFWHIPKCLQLGKNVVQSSFRGVCTSFTRSSRTIISSLTAYGKTNEYENVGIPYCSIEQKRIHRILGYTSMLWPGYSEVAKGFQRCIRLYALLFSSLFPRPSFHPFPLTRAAVRTKRSEQSRAAFCFSTFA